MKPEQLCRCYVGDGRYDDTINAMIKTHDLREILGVVMRASKGTENPAKVIERIELLQKL